MFSRQLVMRVVLGAGGLVSALLLAGCSATGEWWVVDSEQLWIS